MGDDQNGKGFGTAVGWLSGGLVLLTATLAAVGGVTGGIARMFRNSADAEILSALGLVIAGVLLAVCSNLVDRVKHPRTPVVLLLVSVLAFGGGTLYSLGLMINATQKQDRPTLNGQLIPSAGAGWLLKIQASASGLRADDQLQVLVYGQPEGGKAVSPMSTPAPYLDGDRLLFTQAGPNVEGVAAQNFDIPLPNLPHYETIIVTAVIGEYPRNCEGRTVNVRDNTEFLVPPEVREDGKPLKRDGTLSCLTFAAPPPAAPSSAAPSPARVVPAPRLSR